MVKVIKVKRKDNEYRLKCDECGAELEFNDKDTYEGAYGCYYVTCPECKNERMVDGKECVDLDSHNIKFPLHFVPPSQKAVNLADEKIQEYVRQCLKSLEDDDEDWGVFSLTGSGNTMVFAFKYENEYIVYVTKDYYETSICRE